MGDSNLIDFPRDRLSTDDLDDLEACEPALSEADYDRVLDRVVATAPALAGELRRGRRALAGRYREFVGAPPRHRARLLEAGSPLELVLLARRLVERSFEHRLERPERSLELALLAVQAAGATERTCSLTPEMSADLRAEALIALGNARRVTSDVAGAANALREADRLLDQGAGDPAVRADYYNRLAALKFSQGMCAEAVAAVDHEIVLRERLGDKAKLGVALVDRGIVSCWFESLAVGCDYLIRGLQLIDEPMPMLLALQTVADRLARDGRGHEALRVIRVARSVLSLEENDEQNDSALHGTRLLWAEGLAYRALSRYDEARRALSRVHEVLIAEGRTFRAALVSLDLAAVHAASGENEEAKALAEEAYAVFRAAQLEERALTAFLVFYRAAAAAELTEELAVRFADFMARYKLDRRLRFEG